MSKKTKKLILSAVIAALILWIGDAVITASSFETCVYEYKDQVGNQQLEEYLSFFLVTFLKHPTLIFRCGDHFLEIHRDGITVLATLFIAIFTATLWAATKGLWKSAESQSEMMKDTVAQAVRSATAMEGVATSMAANAASIKESVTTSKTISERQKTFGEMQMRSYITVLVGAFYDQNRELDAHLQIHPVILNTGNTPAHELVFRGVVAVRPYRPGPDFDFTLPPIDEERSVITVGPHQQTTMSFGTTEWFSDEEVAVIKRATDQRVYVYGTVNYKDVFGNDRFTNFCYSMTWSVQGQPIGSWTRRHNDSN